MEEILMKVDEMKVGSYLIACRFPLPDNKAWRLIEVVGEGVDTVWLYRKCFDVDIPGNGKSTNIFSKAYNFQ